jgi:hypothetical protein
VCVTHLCWKAAGGARGARARCGSVVLTGRGRGGELLGWLPLCVRVEVSRHVSRSLFLYTQVSFPLYAGHFSDVLRSLIADMRRFLIVILVCSGADVLHVCVTSRAGGHVSLHQD